MSTSIIESSTQRFTAEPGAAQSAPAVTASLVDGRARLSAGSFTWDADLAPAIGGGNLAPSPTAYLLGALAGCAVAFVHDTLAHSRRARRADTRSGSARGCRRRPPVRGRRPS